jgi:hypothetical protein
LTYEGIQEAILFAAASLKNDIYLELPKAA